MRTQIKQKLLNSHRQFYAMSRFAKKSVVRCLKINIMAVAVLFFMLIISVSADTNIISNKLSNKDNKLGSLLRKSSYKISTTSAPRIKLSETPECADDIRRICPTSILNNNFAVLDCLQNDKVIIYVFNFYNMFYICYVFDPIHYLHNDAKLNENFIFINLKDIDQNVLLKQKGFSMCLL